MKRHEAAVFRFARAISPDEAAAEDALQEAFLGAWRGARTFRGDASVRNWLLTIVRNAIDRQHRKRVDEPEDIEPLWSSVSLPDGVRRKTRRRSRCNASRGNCSSRRWSG